MSANGTTFSFVATKGSPKADVLIVPLAAKPQPPLELVARVDKLCDDAVSQVLAAKAIRPDVGHLVHSTSGGGCRRVLVVSLGDLKRVRPHDVRCAAARAAKWLVDEKVRSAALWLDGLITTDVDESPAEWATGMALAGFRFAEFKAPDKNTPDSVRVQLCASEAGHVSHASRAIKGALPLAEAVNYTRQLAHQPANVINPQSLAAEARKLARNGTLKCTVTQAPQLKKMGMNGLLAVGQGAKHPSCLIQLEYRGAPRTRARTVLVGKAITFDTGGYSLKPRDGMVGMKFDKCGGVTVLGILKAAADLKLKCNLVGLLAAAENAVSQDAYRVDDILKMMNGKTVEVNNTDAEGRLVMADTLHYAQQKLKPTALIDMATLTGGVGVALGSAAAGIMANEDAIAADLGEAGRRTHERLWRLPLWDDYRDLIRSDEADIRNSGTRREAHCIVGGMFLKEFVKDNMPWAHLDIASVATDDHGKGPYGKGATGFGVRLLVEFLRLRGA